MVYFLLGITLPALSQQGGSSYVPLQKMPVLKNLTEANTTVWDIGLKGLKSVTLTFDGHDTIVYSISRERLRRATFTLLDSNAVLAETDFKSNIIWGGFTDSLQGTYIFKVKNHSFLGNKFTLQIKKSIPKPVEPKKERGPDTTWYYPDSLVSKLDTTVYLACTLNLNQSQEYILPYKTDSTAFCATVVKKIETSLQTFSDKAKKPKRTTVVASEDSKISSLAQGDFLIYLKKNSWLDSLNNSPDNERQIRKITIGSNQKLVLVNNDKVVGKYVHIQVKEIMPCRKPIPIVKNAK